MSLTDAHLDRIIIKRVRPRGDWPDMYIASGVLLARHKIDDPKGQPAEFTIHGRFDVGADEEPYQSVEQRAKEVLRNNLEMLTDAFG